MVAKLDCNELVVAFGVFHTRRGVFLAIVARFVVVRLGI